MPATTSIRPALLISASRRPNLSNVALSQASAEAGSSASNRATSGGVGQSPNFPSISFGRLPPSETLYP